MNTAPTVGEAEIAATRLELAREHPEAATMMAACDVAKVLQKKGYEVTVRPVHLHFAPKRPEDLAPPEPVPACDIIFTNPTTREVRASALTLGDYPKMLAASRNLPAAGGSRIVVPQMGPLGGIRA